MQQLLQHAVRSGTIISVLAGRDSEQIQDVYAIGRRPRVRPGRVTAEPARVILDCDPGIDDALAIVFGCGHPGLDLVGLTTVSGNVNLDR